MVDGLKLFCVLVCNVVLMDEGIVREDRVVWLIGVVFDRFGLMGIILFINVDVGKIGCERDCCFWWFVRVGVVVCCFWWELDIMFVLILIFESGRGGVVVGLGSGEEEGGVEVGMEWDWLLVLVGGC